MRSRTITVTGAFSNIGRAAAHELAARGWRVRTLTNRPPDDSGIVAPRDVSALRFDAEHLAGALLGSDVVVNTYWVREPSHGESHAAAVSNSCMLIDAARRAGVERFVQVSVTHATPDSPSPYYAGKAAVDAWVRRRFASHAIVQPTLVVGPNDVLTGNMAWALRRSPVALVPAGSRPLQPVLLDDLARLLADQVEATGEATTEAAGPERYEFDEYLTLVASGLGRSVALARVPAGAFLAVMGIAGRLLGDTIVTRDELASLARGSLVPRGEPTCAGSVSQWLATHGSGLGRRYINDRQARRVSSAAARSSWV